MYLQNIEEHQADCELSCKHYYCEKENNNWNSSNETYFASYSMGSVPPEDFSDKFG